MKTNFKIKKIILLASIAMLSMNLLVGCGSSDDSKEVLNIYNIGDYIDPELVTQFEDEYGIKVNYESYDTNEAMYQKLKSGSTNYDLAFPSDYMVEKLISEDMIEEINFDNIPNFENISEEFVNPSYDKENTYSVPYLWGTYGIIYNKSVVKENVDSWDILWDEKYEGDIMMLDSMRDSMAIALKKLGYSMNSTDPKEIEEAKLELQKQKPLVLSYVNDESIDRIVAEEAAIGIAYSGDAVVMKERNENLEYVIPKEGSNKWVDTMVIPKGAENKDNAEKFINFLLEAESAKANADYIGYAIPNSKGLELLEDGQKNDPAMYPSKEVLENTETFVDLTEEALTIYDKAWTELKSY